MKFILLIAGCLCMAACSPNGILSNNQLPTELNYAPRPLTVLIVNDGGIVFKDASGAIYAYANSFFFTAPFIKGAKKGDVLP